MTLKEQDSGIGDGGVQPGRRPEFRIWDGTPIRDAELKTDVPQVLQLYKSLHAIQHLADVTPDTTARETLNYYTRHKEARLFVATSRDGKIVGAVTVTKEEGLKSAKINRAVVAEDQQGKGIAHQLVRRALSYAFSPEAAGGLDASQVMLGVILDVSGSDRATGVFEKVGFDFWGTRLQNRCYGWDITKGELVLRDVRQMLLQKSSYEMRRGRDLATPPQQSVS